MWEKKASQKNETPEWMKKPKAGAAKVFGDSSDEEKPEAKQE